MNICPKCGHDYGDPAYTNERAYIEVRGGCIACAYEQLPENTRPPYGEFLRAAMKSLEAKSEIL
jgi:hypothetical protein